MWSRPTAAQLAHIDRTQLTQTTDNEALVGARAARSACLFSLMCRGARSPSALAGVSLLAAESETPFSCPCSAWPSTATRFQGCAALKSSSSVPTSRCARRRCHRCDALPVSCNFSPHARQETSQPHSHRTGTRLRRSGNSLPHSSSGILATISPSSLQTCARCLAFCRPGLSAVSDSDLGAQHGNIPFPQSMRDKVNASRSIAAVALERIRTSSAYAAFAAQARTSNLQAAPCAVRPQRATARWLSLSLLTLASLGPAVARAGRRGGEERRRDRVHARQGGALLPHALPRLPRDEGPSSISNV